MAKDTKLSDVAVNAEADALAALLDGGFVDFYGGDKPPSANTPVSDQPRAASLTLGTPAFQLAVAGVLTANPVAPTVIEADVNPVTWARFTRADHTTAIMDQTVGKSASNIGVPTTKFVAGVVLSISSITHTIAKSTPGS